MFYERKNVDGEERGLSVPDSPQCPLLLFYEHFQTQLLSYQKILYISLKKNLFTC